MKLIRYGNENNEKPGVVIDDTLYDVSVLGEDYDEKFFQSDGLERLEEFIQKNKKNLKPLPEQVRLACPVANPSKIVCIGLNYADHALETGASTPSEPVIFLKSTTAICGANDNIIIPRNSEKTDWEVELSVIIGKRASYVSEENAMDYVAGFCLHNDVSERAFQMERNGTWDKGKGCDTFAPLGPWLVTKEEIKDAHNLNLWLSVNDTLMQKSSTANLIFQIPFLISYVSQFMTLRAGDIISTGTPAGVGLGMQPQVFLKPGDVVKCGIDGLGEACQHVIAYTK